VIPHHQWASKLIGFGFHVEYRPGSRNTVDDSLLHHSAEEATVVALLEPSFNLFDTLHQELIDILELQLLKQEVAVL
jgi:hypothetical protein